MRWGITIIPSDCWRAPMGPTCVFNPRHIMWSCMFDIDMPHPIWAQRAQWLVPREKLSLPCRWPQLWHIGMHSVLLWGTLPCAGLGKRCSCGESLHTLLHCPSYTLTNTHKQTSSKSQGIYIFICEFREKTHCHQNVAYGPPLMEHISWAQCDTVTQKTIDLTAWHH